MLFDKHVNISFAISICVHLVILTWMHYANIQEQRKVIIITDVELIEPLPIEEPQVVQPVKKKKTPIIQSILKTSKEATINILKKMKLVPPVPKEKKEDIVEIDRRIKKKLLHPGEQEDKTTEEVKPIEIKKQLRKESLAKLYKKEDKLPDIIDLPKRKISIDKKKSPVFELPQKIKLAEVGEKQIEIKRERTTYPKYRKSLTDIFKQSPQEAIPKKYIFKKKDKEKKIIPLPKKPAGFNSALLDIKKKEMTAPIKIVKKKRKERKVVYSRDRVQKIFATSAQPQKKSTQLVEIRKKEKQKKAIKPVTKPQKKITDILTSAQPAVKDKFDVLRKKGTTKRVSLTGQLSKRRRIYEPIPEYPAWAERRGIEAQVVIYFVVAPDGRVKPENTYVELTSGYPRLDKLALEALKKWRFVPLQPNVPQVDQWGRVTFRFILR
jgi:TonB family protein